MLIVLRHLIVDDDYPKLFLVPIILSVHMLLGFCFEPDSLNVPIKRYGIS